MIRFAEPQFLILLLAIPITWFLARRLKLIPFGRRLAILTVRTLVLCSIIFALAKIELRRESRELSVFYLLDFSDSVPQDLQEKEMKNMETLPAKAGSHDHTGVIVFGDAPSMETSPVQKYQFEGKIMSQIGGERTDIASAVRLALAAFPSDHMRRIALMSDGNENSGSTLEIARFAKNSGVPIDVIPLQYSARNDVQIEKLVVPQRTSKDAPFELKVYLNAQQQSEGMLHIFRDGAMIAEEKVSLTPGRNAPLVLSQRLSEGGFHNYSATIDVPGDSRPQNNKGNGFTYLKAEPRVLLIEGSSLDDAAYLTSALEQENIKVDLAATSGIPVTIDGLQKYDSLIFSNVAAGDMSGAQMEMIERGVHDLGIGFIMIGGDKSFGAGGYIDSPIEKALPVTMDIKQKKMLPNGALVIILHTCEIPSGNAWAREIGLASLNVLAAQDYFGVVYFGQNTGIGGGWGEYWLWEPGLQLAGDKSMMRNKLRGVQPLDMPNYDPTLDMAAKELKKVKAQTKHIVLISDGDAAPPSQATVNAVRDQGISVSTVAIAPHNGQTVSTLEKIATWGGGNFYYPKTSDELPRIFTKEATVVRKSLIVEEPFTPRMSSASEILLGIGGLPPLEGYVMTSVKDLATLALTTEREDPLLAHWRYGLGKTVAFTSDAKDKWATNWLQSPTYLKFWAQTVRWSLRETSSSTLQTNTEINGTSGKVTVDAIDADGNFRNFLNMSATVIGPDFKSVSVPVTQIAPGRYEGSFAASKVGAYLSTVTASEKGKDEVAEFSTSGASVAYSPEYQTSASADEFLKRVAEASGGRYVDDLKTYQPYSRDLNRVRSPEQLWPWFLMLGIILMPIDIFLRRVYLNWGDIVSWFGRKFGRTKVEETGGTRLENLRAAKARAAAEREEEKEDRAAREAFRDKLAKTETSGEGSVFEPPASTGPRPPARSTKQTITPDNEGPRPPSPQGGMESLLEAKRRAQQKKKK
ncbi:VWA domain-containing protein [soil metagenome]